MLTEKEIDDIYENRKKLDYLKKKMNDLITNITQEIDNSKYLDDEIKEIIKKLFNIKPEDRNIQLKFDE